MDAYDGITPPCLDESPVGQFAEHCLESAAGFSRAENDDGIARSNEKN